MTTLQVVTKCRNCTEKDTTRRRELGKLDGTNITLPESRPQRSRTLRSVAATESPHTRINEQHPFIHCDFATPLLLKNGHIPGSEAVLGKFKPPARYKQPRGGFNANQRTCTTLGSMTALFKGPSLSGLQRQKEGQLNTPSERRKRLANFPLRNLLSKYYILDAISGTTPEVINNCLDLMYAEPPIRPLADRLVSVYLSTPRPWLALRGMIRNFFTDVLHTTLDILSDALVCTDHVLLHTLSNPVLTIREQELASPYLFTCVRARRHVIVMLQRKVQDFVISLSHKSWVCNFQEPPSSDRFQ